MLRLLLVVSLLGLALGYPTEFLPYDPENPPVTAFNYHEKVGIPAASSVKAAEDALNFDGSRIVGGSAANLGQYPHIGGLDITLTTNQRSLCGSSLISNTKLVTAAHCWWDGNNQARHFVVVLGTVTVFSGGHRVQTNNVVMHPNWNPRNIQNDVAMIAIPRVNYNNHIRNINMATGNNNFVGQNAQAAGWGVQRDGQGIATNQRLHHVTVRVITNADCRRRFPGIIADSMICIDGSQGRSTCGGDSGGPLQIGNTLIGITSFGFAGGCERGWPAAFSRVTSFESWIRSRM